jgi:hypothetical protein
MGFGGFASVTGVGYRLQGRRAQGARRTWPCAAVVAALLGGCTAPDSDPIYWWRQLEGGALAEGRVPPPNADAPFPNLSTVPTRPQVQGAVARARVAERLETDRRDAAFAARQPIAALEPTRPAPPPSAEAAMGASLAAASPAPAPAAPTPAPAAPAPAPPPAPVAAAPRPTPAPIPAPPIPAPVASVPVDPGPVDVFLPDMPPTPPAPPRLPGVAAVTRPAPPRPAPPPAPVAVAPAPGVPVPVAFPRDSAVLPDGAQASLAAIAAQRAGRDVWVVGYGESDDADPAIQAAALRLAFARARSLMAGLAQAGVPVEAMLVRAEALGRGGVARIAE